MWQAEEGERKNMLTSLQEQHRPCTTAQAMHKGRWAQNLKLDTFVKT